MSRIPETRAIESPVQLTALLREIKTAVADGVLQQTTPDAPQLLADTSFAEIVEEGPWPDYIEMFFVVSQTGQRYRLVAETFHGAGGSWRRA